VTNDEVRRISTFLFGNSTRLEVAAAIGRLEGKPISVKVVSQESGIEANRVQEQIAHFRRAGMLIPTFDPESRRKDHLTVSSSYWTSAERLLEELRDREDL
jgi:hypothetical protein